MKEKNLKRVSQKNYKITRDKTLPQESNQKDKYRAVPLVKYSGPFLKWTREKPQLMDQRTRKLMIIHEALNPRDDIDRLYVSRKEGESGLASIEIRFDALIQRLKTTYKSVQQDGLQPRETILRTRGPAERQ